MPLLNISFFHFHSLFHSRTCITNAHVHIEKPKACKHNIQKDQRCYVGAKIYSPLMKTHLSTQPIQHEMLSYSIFPNANG
ncbi:hypothetical protein EUGRSUZ_A02684 [Eucalyptus grandis]|uniref:Uncharacterized protein n=2 Tax=Eucalyptus grandis TaxID=71139 RepID=A0ACC3M801_EUCGR|nr:hypothetical protein EUGRSUZ_A02684 [Eucalyptus grandis]